MSIESMVAGACRIAASAASCDPVQTPVPNLTVFSAMGPVDPVPALFEPRFYVLLQGAKRMDIAGRQHFLRPGGCAVSTLGLPFRVEVVEASPERPYLGLGFALDTARVVELLLDMPDGGNAPADTPAFASGYLTRELAEPMERMLRLVESPADIPVLAPLFEREFLYRLAKSPLGATLRRAGGKHSRFAQVRAAAEWLRAHSGEPMRVEALAARVGMSVTSLHRHFRALTGTSPLAYQRHLRLLGARASIASGGLSVTAAAYASGYASAAQFSREYRAMFGVAPKGDKPRAVSGAPPGSVSGQSPEAVERKRSGVGVNP